MREDRVLDWLRGQGYPHMRRADMVRAELVAAARVALAGGSSSHNRSSSNRPARRNQGRFAATREELTPPKHMTPPEGDSISETLTTSFADLLSEHLDMEAHSERGKDVHRNTFADDSATRTGLNVVPIATPSREIVDARLAMERERADNDLKVANARVRAAEEETLLLRREIEAGRGLVIENASLKDARDNLAKEVATLQEKLAEVEHERATLDTTCATLQERVVELESVQHDLESLEVDHSSIITDLEATQQREVAWRARALELERASQSTGLDTVLNRAGASSPRMKQSLLRGILASDRTAEDFIKTIEKVDENTFTNLMKTHTRRVCANTLCRKCVLRQRRIPVVIDDAKQCEICLGREEKRFFEAMVCEASRAGVRRILIFGADRDLKSRLYDLSEGHQLDLRLIDSREEISRARAQGRIDGCDCFVTWTQHVLEPNLYLEAARALRRLWVVVNADPSDVGGMSRQIAYRLARHSHLITG